MSLKKLASETAIYGVSSVLGRLLNFVLITPFIMRVLPDAAEYGTVGILFFYTAFFIALLVFRMDTVVFRFASRQEYSATAVCSRAQQFVWTTVAVWILAGLGFAQEIANWMQYPDQVIYVRLVVLIVAFDVLSAVPLARLRLEQRPWFFAIVNLANIFINIILIYFLLYFVPRWAAAGNSFGWYDQTYQIAYYLFAILVAGIARYLLLIGDRLLRPISESGAVVLDALDDDLRSDSSGSSVDSNASFNESKPALSPSLKTMLGYAAPLVIVALCGIINTLVGPEMLRRFLGGTYLENEYWAGQYNAAMKMAVFLTLFTTAYNFAAEPFFFRQRGQDPNNQNLDIYAKATRAFALAASLAIAAILLLLPILQLYISKNLREGLEILPILMAANFMLALYYNFAMSYKLTDRTYLGGYIAVGGSLIVILGNVFFVPQFGIYAPAFAGLACFTFMAFCAWLVSKKYFPVPYELGRIGLYALLTAGVVALGWLLENIFLRAGLLIAFSGLLVAMEWKWIRGL